MIHRLVLLAASIGLALLVSSCNIDQNHHRDMMNDGRMGSGMMQEQSRQNGQSGIMDGEDGASGMRGGLRENTPQNYSRQSSQPLTSERARSLAQQYLESTGNTGFILGEGSEANSNYEFPLLLRSDSSRVASLLVDKRTGAVSSRR